MCIFFVGLLLSWNLLTKTNLEEGQHKNWKNGQQKNGEPDSSNKVKRRKPVETSKITLKWNAKNNKPRWNDHHTRTTYSTTTTKLRTGAVNVFVNSIKASHQSRTMNVVNYSQHPRNFRPYIVLQLHQGWNGIRPLLLIKKDPFSMYRYLLTIYCNV